MSASDSGLGTCDNMGQGTQVGLALGKQDLLRDKDPPEWA